MPPVEFKDVTLVAEHAPDETIEDDGTGVKHAVELPGFIHIGAVLDGTYHRLFTFKAAKFLKTHAENQAAADTPAE